MLTHGDVLDYVPVDGDLVVGVLTGGSQLDNTLVHGGKGFLPKGVIAVKKLFNSHTMDDKMFHREVETMMVTHPNIVRLLGGYCAPEYLCHGKMSPKSDIYSFGMIVLELVTGCKENPTIAKVNLFTNDMLGIEPLDVQLPFELNKQLSCSIELENDTDDYIAFSISTTSIRSYSINPNKDIVPPRSKTTVTITMEPEGKPLLERCKDDFYVYSTRVDRSMLDIAVTDATFKETLDEVVDKVNLAIILDKSALSVD
ncbi:hypothetical protein PR202_ga27621 [Eleusine coracana subsp. coracana]|uniref:MSP domain-containing protein n=1 Tax=Eleusine coracana subsp. coracana TaxID=191504 RepID=A0AAV5DHC5_ELECO|nr:hypothetical protein PR202_ga27621 [Eleusine coracana subsp. coracana]